MHTRTHRSGRAAGFSALELIITLAVLGILLAATLRLVSLATARSSTEQSKLDMFQETREFMDQMSRDLRQSGAPSFRNFTSGALPYSPPQNNSRVAAGLIKVAANELWFEGDVNGDGTVSVVHYWLDTSTTNNCPCLKRSQLPKVDNADVYTGQTTPSYQTEVQGVRNTGIFSAFIKGSTGTPVTLPVNFNSNGATIADIDTVQAVLTVQAPLQDPETKIKPLSTLVITVRLNNCSLAAKEKSMSCL
ncbi:MAG TPA: type II secretion system protein [Terriglobia bacterium]|nr:type II secretion system protein [Terriglobia bacterium]